MTPLRLTSPTGVVHADGGTAAGLRWTVCGRLAATGWGRRIQRPVPEISCRSCLGLMTEKGIA